MVTPASDRAEIAALAPCWAADTGCFSDTRTFSLDEYLAMLERMQPLAHKCLFATTPDVVGDAAATWARSKDVLPAIRALGYKAALVAQDGQEEPDWGAFDVLFMGGTTEFKLSEAAYRLVAEARARGKWCHMGRVNSRLRLYAAKSGGYQSADGTDFRFAPSRRMAQFTRWLAEVQQQAVMEVGGQ